MDDLPGSVQRAIWRLRELVLDPAVLEIICTAAAGLTTATIEAQSPPRTRRASPR
jgi:hypothetical protein